MGVETNAELIRALERRIQDGNGDVIELKRARNSLLNISTRVPPEILADIFSWILFRPNPAPGVESHLHGLCKDSYNFLLVRNHWFQVASHTPELWTYCGNTLQDWKKWFRRHPQSASVDLVLNDRPRPTTQPSIDHTVRDALRDHATRDIIRQVHLKCYDGKLLSIIVPSITHEGEGVQCRSIESIDIRNQWMGPPGRGFFDVSHFFTRIRLPKLRNLLLHGLLKLPPWNHLVHQTTVLRIEKSSQSLSPTASQFFSMLISNPGLQVLSLDGPVIPKDDDNSFASQITLRHLEKLYLRGELHHVVMVLERLVFPHPLNFIQVVAFNSTVESVLQNLGSYVQRYFRGDRGFRDQLKLEAHAFHGIRFVVSVKGEHRADGSSPFSASFEVYPYRFVREDVLQNLCHDFVTFIPQERVCTFDTNLPPDKLQDLYIAMPNIKGLDLIDL